MDSIVKMNLSIKARQSMENSNISLKAKIGELEE
jgi:hypothetical protein